MKHVFARQDGSVRVEERDIHGHTWTEVILLPMRWSEPYGDEGYPTTREYTYHRTGKIGNITTWIER